MLKGRVALVDKIGWRMPPRQLPVVPMLIIAWHFLLPGPVSGGFTGWLTEAALRERGIEREEGAGVGAAGRWAASCPQAGGEKVPVPLCTDSG